MLKGKNQRFFKNKLQAHLNSAFSNFTLELNATHDKAVIKNYKECDEEKIIKSLERIPGLHSYSLGEVIQNNDQSIINFITQKLETLPDKQIFKIETKRLDKTLPYTSMDYSRRIAKLLYDNIKNIELEIKNFTSKIHFEVISEKEVVVYFDKHPLLGGFPAHSQARALGLISGGIDSPVASILMLKKGINLELIHFESTPMTPLESIDKVFTLVSEIATFCPKQQIKLHIIPFIEIHQQILKNVADSYIITILRRMMYRCASRLCDKYGIATIVSGDSVGQVASQTLESLAVVGTVSKYNILRPLAGFDKEDIIKISKKFNLYETAILPFEDCCTVYLPKNPTTKPSTQKASFWESKFMFENLIDKAVENAISIDVKASKNYNFAKLGLDFKNSYESWINDRNNKQGK